MNDTADIFEDNFKIEQTSTAIKTDNDKQYCVLKVPLFETVKREYHVPYLWGARIYNY